MGNKASTTRSDESKEKELQPAANDSKDASMEFGGQLQPVKDSSNGEILNLGLEHVGSGSSVQVGKNGAAAKIRVDLVDKCPQQSKMKNIKNELKKKIVPKMDELENQTNAIEELVNQATCGEGEINTTMMKALVANMQNWQQSIYDTINGYIAFTGYHAVTNVTNLNDTEYAQACETQLRQSLLNTANRAYQTIYGNTIVLFRALKNDKKYEQLRQDEKFSAILNNIDKMIQKQLQNPTEIEMTNNDRVLEDVSAVANGMESLHQRAIELNASQDIIAELSFWNKVWKWLKKFLMVVGCVILFILACVAFLVLVGVLLLSVAGFILGYPPKK